MRKNFLAIYALVGALVASPVFTSCVDNEESPSVTQLRGAKAEQLKAAAALAQAQAAAETTLANAEAALKAAQAEYQNALAEAKKAETANQEEMTKQAQERFALEIAQLEAQTEMYLLQYQASIQNYKNQLEDAEYNRFNQLYSRYLNELDELIDMQRQLVNDKNQLARLEANVISQEAWNQYYIKNQEREIAACEAQIALLKDPAYAALDEQDIYAKWVVANKEANLAITAFNANNPSIEALVKAGSAYKEKTEAMFDYVELIDKINNIRNVINWSSWTHGSFYYYTGADYDNAYNSSVNGKIYNEVRINETKKLEATRVYADNVKNYADQLGKADDTKDKNTAYGRLAAANADLTAAKALPETTDAEKATKKQAISDAEYAIAQATDQLARYQLWYNNAVEAQTEFTEALAAIDVNAINKAYNEWEDAKKAQDEAYEAWEEAREGVQEKQNAANALWNLYVNASIDVEQQIKSLEASILECKAEIEGYKVNSEEQNLANAKEDIANLEAKIAVQEKVVADAKAAVDAYLATEEETPAE